MSGVPLRPRAEKVVHTLRFWKDGFSVDDGPLRNGQEPADKAFLESVSKGYGTHTHVSYSHNQFFKVQLLLFVCSID